MSLTGIQLAITVIEVAHINNTELTEFIIVEMSVELFDQVADIFGLKGSEDTIAHSEEMSGMMVIGLSNSVFINGYRGITLGMEELGFG